MGMESLVLHVVGMSLLVERGGGNRNFGSGGNGNGEVGGRMDKKLGDC
jgi:hypothetical protein